MNVEEYLMALDDSDFLEHHGVKGMKWGVRRNLSEHRLKKYNRRINRSAARSNPLTRESLLRNTYLAEKHSEKMNTRAYNAKKKGDTKTYNEAVKYSERFTKTAERGRKFLKDMGYSDTAVSALIAGRQMSIWGMDPLHQSRMARRYLK